MPSRGLCSGGLIWTLNRYDDFLRLSAMEAVRRAMGAVRWVIECVCVCAPANSCSECGCVWEEA